MRGRIVFLLEEPSMKVLLEGLLPRLLPGLAAGEHFLCLSHEGKSDLERSIPRKLSGFREPGARFVILRDNDNGDCVDLKARMRALCERSGRPEALVRLVCQELESWYIGDLSAMAEAFASPKVNSPSQRKRYAHPDTWHKPSAEVRRLVSTFQKISGARLMAVHLGEDDNLSHSFRAFVTGVRKLAADMGHLVER